MPTLLRDLSQAVRGWRARPVPAAVAVLTLALGVGVNVTIFGVVEALILRPLPAVSRPDRVVITKGNPFSYQAWRRFSDVQRSLDGIAAWQQWSLNLVADGEAMRIRGLVVSPNYFDVLGVSPARGRVLGAPDDERAGAPAAVLSERFWRSRFGGAEGVVGATVTINRVPVTVVGVAAAGFQGTELDYAADVFLPVTAIDALRAASGRGALLSNAGRHWLRGAARLRPGVTLAAAQADVDRAAADLTREIPPFDTATIPLVPLVRTAFPGSAREGAVRALTLVSAVAACVLLVACANVANLLAGLGEARRGEFGIRLALGARPRRIVAQLLVETLLLALAASAAGLLLARWAMAALAGIRLTAHVPIALAGVIDAWVAALAGGLALVITLACGLAPALRARRADVGRMLGRAGVVRAARGRPGLTDVLVAAQVAASMLLAIASVVFLAAVRNQGLIPTGFETSGVAFVRLDAQLAGFSREQGEAFFERVSERAAALPGVVAVGRAIGEPLGGVAFVRTIAGPGDGRPVRVQNDVVSPGYFRALGIPLVAGREFDSRSPAGSVIVNESLARMLWPGRSAVGQVIEARDQGAPISLVVAVARDSRYENLQEQAVPFVYSRLADDYDGSQVIFARARTRSDDLAAALRRVSRETDAGVPVVNAATMEEHLASNLAQPRAVAGLVTILATLTAVLAAAGLYGTLSLAAASRRRETAVRVALGAGPVRVAAALATRAWTAVGAGMAGGTAMAAPAAGLVSSQIYGLSPLDPGVVAASGAIVAAVAVLATIVPVRRALTADPALTLRE
jgi:predicted permease